MTTRNVFLMAVLAAGTIGSARAENWPEFRGPTGQGLAMAEGLPTHWSKTENVAWRTPLPGEGWSSPVLYEGRLYLTAAVPEPDSAKEFSLRALCLDAKSGNILWNKEVFREDEKRFRRIHGKNSHASATPLIDKGQLFVHFGHQGTARLDLDGKVVWRNRMEYNPVHGNGGAPIAVGQALIFSCDGASDPFVVALDRDSGEILWKTQRSVDAAKKFSFTTPLAIDVNGQTQVISPASDMVCALDPRNGREIWRVRYDGYSVIPRPVYGHGLVFICTGYNSPKLLAIRPDGQGDVTDSNVQWTMKRGAPHTPSLLLVGGNLYMASDRGVASCVDAGTGKLQWQERLGGGFSASPLYADGKIYFQNEEGEATVIAPEAKFRRIATNKLGERTLASYAVGDGALFIRSADALYRIQETGK